MKEKLKVYFVASLVGKKRFGENYKLISQALKDLGCEVWDDINKVSPEDIWDSDSNNKEKYFSNVMKKIREADLFVAEDSYPSSSVGYEIGFAVENNKPVLVLKSEEIKGFGVPLTGNPSKLLSVASYSSKNLKNKLKQFMKKVEKGIFVKRLPIEFTQTQVEYVSYRQRSGTRKISFNSAVRQVIEEALDADMVYRDLNKDLDD